MLAEQATIPTTGSMNAMAMLRQELAMGSREDPFASVTFSSLGLKGPPLPSSLDAYAPAAIALGMICSFNSEEHFKVNPQRLQRIRKLPPSGITGMKNRVNQRFDSMAVNTVVRLQLEQGY